MRDIVRGILKRGVQKLLRYKLSSDAVYRRIEQFDNLLNDVLGGLCSLEEKVGCQRVRNFFLSSFSHFIDGNTEYQRECSKVLQRVNGVTCPRTYRDLVTGPRQMLRFPGSCCGLFLWLSLDPGIWELICLACLGYAVQDVQFL